ncbi:hypothetical protein Vadar_003024 [Vaccinium darrowii]|uniref:Uncharacterized protein n=1 Tax=Vaccinium darrowii TaxID=229202 RepID=A0ACB7Z2U5_9ERIC|nr:hypothetical protein Vadar_003024 [Vaccinium darrowii]
MSSPTTPLNRHARIPPNATLDTPFSPVIRLFSRRTPSFSSSSSSSSDSSRRSSSFHDDSPLFSPSTPLWSSGIPFSWEKLPGIPKRQLSKKMNPSLSKNLLPLPPAGTPPITPSKQKVISSDEVRDPFFAALVECSKDDDQDLKGSKITKSLSDRFGFIGSYTSCKSNCSVSESIIYVPRSHG